MLVLPVHSPAASFRASRTGGRYFPGFTAGKPMSMYCPPRVCLSLPNIPSALLYKRLSVLSVRFPCFTIAACVRCAIVSQKPRLSKNYS